MKNAEGERRKRHGLFRDEQGALSSARFGLWITIAVAVITILTDIALTVFTSIEARIPNTVYALEATMFTAFAAWAAGPRIAQYLGPQIGQIASGIASSRRDQRLPSKTDDESFDG